MPSPFPGMNPFLEQADSWEDFHQRFITHAADTLSGPVGPNYLVKVEVRLILHELSAEERRFMARALDTERLASVEILDRRDRRVVTVIELLSPSNKAAGPDRDDYLLKRSRVLDGRTHLVEIDLRRGGERPHDPPLPSCDYYVLVSRWQDRPAVGFWPLALRERLPVIPIPLAPPDADVSLDLQDLLHRVYDAAGYHKYIYALTPEPPLLAADLAWARGLVRESAGVA